MPTKKRFNIGISWTHNLVLWWGHSDDNPVSLQWHEPVKDELARVKETALSRVDNSHPSHQFICAWLVNLILGSFISANRGVDSIFFQNTGNTYWRSSEREPWLWWSLDKVLPAPPGSARVDPAWTSGQKVYKGGLLNNII